jgi:hypothetical protein
MCRSLFCAIRLFATVNRDDEAVGGKILTHRTYAVSSDSKGGLQLKWARSVYSAAARIIYMKI